MEIDRFHEKGIKGKGIKLAILDSGLGENYQSIGNIGKNGENLSMNIV